MSETTDQLSERDRREYAAQSLLSALRSKPTPARYAWGRDISVESGLLQEGSRFEFVQVMRLLGRMVETAARNPAMPAQMLEVPGKARDASPPLQMDMPEDRLLLQPLLPVAEPPAVTEPKQRLRIRLRGRIDFDFQPASVHSVRRLGAQPGVENGEDEIEVIANLLALAGTNAPLPEPFGEMILERQKLRDMATTDFLDIFHHRLLELYYSTALHSSPWLAWVHPAGNELAEMVYAFVGLGNAKLRDRGLVPDRVWLRYAGLLWHRPRSAAALIVLLEDHFKVNFRLGAPKGRWARIEPEDCSRVGRPSCRLGRTATLGRRVWLQDDTIFLHVGPLSEDAFAAFLPRGERHAQLLEMIRFFLQDDVVVELQLELEPAVARPAELGRSRLGWTAWMRPKPTTERLRVRVRHDSWVSGHQQNRNAGSREVLSAQTPGKPRGREG